LKFQISNLRLDRLTAVAFAAVLLACGAACASKGESGSTGGEGRGAAGASTPTAAASPAAAAARGESGGTVDAELSARLKAVGERAGGEFGAAVVHVETGRSSEAGGARPLALYSVFKLPLAVAVLKDVEEGRLTLGQKVRVEPADASPGVKSNAELWRTTTERSVGEMLELSLVRSDNTSSDQLLKLAGGPSAVTNRMRALGLGGVDVRSSVKELLSEGGAQNTGTAADLARLLVMLQKGEALAQAQTALLLELMSRAQTGERRLRAGVPAGTHVAEKTGTGAPGTSTNDVGLITLPDGTHLAVAVLVSGSKLSTEGQEKLIAEVARAAYEAHVRPNAGASAASPRR
jgi:beta-lactamase class A